jgi:hypothetical protein
LLQFNYWEKKLFTRLLILPVFTVCGFYSVTNLDGDGVNVYFLTFVCLHEDLLCAKVFRNIFGIAGLWPIKLVCSLKLMGGIFFWKGCMFSLQ